MPPPDPASPAPDQPWTDDRTSRVIRPHRPPWFHVQLRPSHGYVLYGQLDLAGLVEMEALHACMAADDATHVVLDIAGLTFVDAFGVNRIVGLTALLLGRGGRLTVVGASARVRRVFAITGLEHLLAGP